MNPTTPETQEKERIVSGLPLHRFQEERLEMLQPYVGRLWDLISYLGCLDYYEAERLLMTVSLRTLRMLQRICHLVEQDEWSQMEYVFEHSAVTGRSRVLTAEDADEGHIDINYREPMWMDRRPGDEDEVAQERADSLYHFGYMRPRQYNETTRHSFMYQESEKDAGIMLYDRTHFLKNFWRPNNPYKFEKGVRLLGFQIH